MLCRDKWVVDAKIANKRKLNRSFGKIIKNQNWPGSFRGAFKVMIATHLRNSTIPDRS